MLALLGWNPGTPQEIFSMDELIEAFSVERISKSGAKFDAAKTKWFNQQYLRAKPDEELAALFAPELQAKNISADPAYVTQVCRLIKEKAHFVNEFWELSSYFFTEPAQYDQEVIRKKWKDQVPAFMADLVSKLEGQENFNAAATEETFKTTAEAAGIGAGQVMQIFRVALSGVGSGPAIFEMVELLGKETTLRRLKKALTAFNA
jgi:glutamyl-tRNA synthetase